MKFIAVGLGCLVVAVLLAGNWLYYPFETAQIAELSPETFMPIANYPDSDYPTYTYNTSLIYLSTENMYYIQWNYVWVNASYHTPDEESVRVYIKEGKLDHISLSIHYQWMDVADYETVGNQPVVYFSSVYHTPYMSTPSLVYTSLIRVLPILFFVILGIVLIGYEASNSTKKSKQKKSR